MEVAIVDLSALRSRAARGSLKGRAVDERARAQVAALLGSARRERQDLIEHLHALQDTYGAISAAHIAALAQAMGLSQVEVYEVATFYHHFDVVRDDAAPPPRITIRVCESVACAMAGCESLYEALKSTYGATCADVRVAKAPCVGQCDRAPMAVVHQTQVSQATVARVQALVQAQVAGVSDTIVGLPSPLADVPGGTRTEAGMNAAPSPAGGVANEIPAFPTFENCAVGTLSVENAIATLNAANLRGLGGAGFPAGKKWSIVRGFAGERVLVVNADEGEPGTFKDRFYLERNPWQFWEGVLIAAWAVAAKVVYVYLRDEYHDLRRAMTQQLACAQEYLRRKAYPLTLELRRGAGAYVCGEESALIESIEGKRGLPRLRPPYIAQQGVFGRPTLAHNVETLYWIPEILRKGAPWWNSFGRHGRTGLRSFSVSGRVKSPGVKLAPAGITLQELVDEYCDGMADGHSLYGYLPGGASGGMLPAALTNVPLDFDTLQPYGCFIGSAAIVVFSQADRARDIALNLMRFFEHESCGQCTPCRSGTAQAAKLMAQTKWDQPLLEDLANTMMDASICGLGQAAPNPMLTAMRYFPQEFA